MAQNYNATDSSFSTHTHSSVSRANTAIDLSATRSPSLGQYCPPYPSSLRRSNTEPYIPPHHHNQYITASSFPQHSFYSDYYATPVPAQARLSHSHHLYPTLPTPVYDHQVESLVVPSAPTQEQYQPLPAVYHDTHVVATPSPNRGQPLTYHPSLSTSQKFLTYAPVSNAPRPMMQPEFTFAGTVMHASTPQMAPTPTFDNISPASYGQASGSVSVETPSMYSTSPPANRYQNMVYSQSLPIQKRQSEQSTFSQFLSTNPKIQPACASKSITPISDGQRLRSSSSTPSSHSVAQPLHQEQKIALSWRQQQLSSGRPSPTVHAPSPLHYSCSADSETVPPTSKKPAKGRPKKTQPPKSPKPEPARKRTKKTSASKTAIDAEISSIKPAMPSVGSRDAEIVANSSTVTQSGRYPTPPLTVEGSPTIATPTKRRRTEWSDNTSGSTTATKKRRVESMEDSIKEPSYIDLPWLISEAEEQLYSSTPSYSRPWERDCCDAPLFNHRKPKCIEAISFGPQVDQVLKFTRPVPLASCLNGEAWLDNPREVISDTLSKNSICNVLTINIVWLGYLNINYMLRISLNEDDRQMTKAHLAAVIARAYKDIVDKHSEDECKQPLWCQAPMLKLGKGGVAFDQIKIMDIQLDEDEIWHPTIEIEYPLETIHGILGSEQDVANLDEYYRSIPIYDQ